MKTTHFLISCTKSIHACGVRHSHFSQHDNNRHRIPFLNNKMANSEFHLSKLWTDLGLITKIHSQRFEEKWISFFLTTLSLGYQISLNSRSFPPNRVFRWYRRLNLWQFSQWESIGNGETVKEISKE